MQRLAQHQTPCMNERPSKLKNSCLAKSCMTSNTPNQKPQTRRVMASSLSWVVQDSILHVLRDSQAFMPGLPLRLIDAIGLPFLGCVFSIDSDAHTESSS